MGTPKFGKVSLDYSGLSRFYWGPASVPINNHGGRGTFCPGSEGRLSNLSLHQISRLSYARQPRMARPMNNPG